MLKLTLKEIAQSTGGIIVGDDQVSIKGINSLFMAQEGEISFLADPRLKDQVGLTKASALITKEKIDFFLGSQLVVKNPSLAYAQVATIFAPPVSRYPGISENAIVGEGTRLGKNVSIYPFVYIGTNSMIGDNVVLFPGAYIGNKVQVGNDSILFPHVTVMSGCKIGQRVIVHAGTVIGSDGFGYAQDGEVSIKIPQTGIVEIEDDVEIGANNTIDRATFGRTLVRKGVKTDNLVQIGHNVVIGENSIIVAQVGIAGSTTLGRNVILGGQVGIIDHVEVGDHVMIGPKSGVSKPIKSGEIVSGIPAMPHRIWLKTRGLIKKLPEIADRLRNLESRLSQLEGKIKKE